MCRLTRLRAENNDKYLYFTCVNSHAKQWKSMANKIIIIIYVWHGKGVRCEHRLFYFFLNRDYDSAFYDSIIFFSKTIEARIVCQMQSIYVKLWYFINLSFFFSPINQCTGANGWYARCVNWIQCRLLAIQFHIGANNNHNNNHNHFDNNRSAQHHHQSIEQFIGGRSIWRWFGWQQWHNRRWDTRFGHREQT